MKKIFSFLLCSFIVFYSCENTSENDNVKLNSVAGLVEKGPFISGSSVSIYELDNNLNGTGKVFETKTDNEGAFSINTSTSLVSPYVKLSVTGFYFNEFTGNLSDAPIVLESLADISETDNAKINVNILTHLEVPRVLRLVSDGIKLAEAKKQAQQELLSAFLITDEIIRFETVSITDNNTSANILIAISSILLNGRSDAKFSEFMSEIRNDLTDGNISDEIKTKIAQSSLGLNYTQIKEHIITRYSDLGKTVEVGAFELFIDGDGDGEIGTIYEEDTPNIIIVDEFLATEDNVEIFLTHCVSSMYSFIQNLYLFDAVYTNLIPENKLQGELRNVYTHNITPNSGIINDLWTNAYQAINRCNTLIDKLIKSEKEWAPKYVHYAQTYRAYLYLNMIELWGDIPLITALSTMDNLYVSRTSQNEILDFIISELESVYSVLPKEATQAECTKYFAKAIQARAYLYQKDFNKVLNCATNIINSGKYALSNNPNTIYAGNSAENIFELPNSEQYSSVQYRNLIQQGDYMPISRYTEVLLIAAEADFQTGNMSQAVNYLNQIRTRQDLENLPSITEEILLTYWQTELQNEGLHFFTLKRFGKATEILNIPDYKLLLPIPEREIMVNPNITQNPGW